jgi:hypothetical protein
MSGIKFTPVRGKMEDVKNAAYAEGHVYFTTDTGKIYLDADEKRITMGGNSGIFYGNMTPPSDADTDQKDFSFSFDEIDGDQVPNPDDLILNIPDGCFYRVENISEEDETIDAIKLTIAGSGGGPSGGGAISSRLTIKDIDNTLTKYFTTDVESAKLRFSVTSNITEDNFITSITYTVGDLDTVLDTDPKDFGIIEFDLLKYIPKMSKTVSTSVKVVVVDNYGTQKSITYRINVIELSLESTIKDKILYTSSQKYDFFCSPKGGTSLKNRKIIYKLYDRSGFLISPSPEDTLVSSQSEVKKELNLSNLGHDVYKFEAQYIGETTEGLIIKSNILTYQIINYSDTGIIVAAVQPEQTIEQFSFTEISYMIGENPNAAITKTDVVLKIKEKTEQT